MQQSEEHVEFEETKREIGPFAFETTQGQKFGIVTRKWFEFDDMSGSRLGKLLKRESTDELYVPRRYRMSSFPEVSSSSTLASNSAYDMIVQRPSTTSCVNLFQGSSQRKPIIKITNFPWEITKDDFVDFFSEFPLDETKIHVPIDRSTGKTKNEAFIELKEFSDVERCIATLNRKILKGRPVSVQSSSPTELFNTHFPFAIPEQNIFLTKDEINSILTVCKNYKVLLTVLSFRCISPENVPRDHLNMFVAYCIYCPGE